MSDRDHVNEELAAYALGSLEEAEAAGVAVHLRSCEECRAELAAYQETLGLLAHGLPPEGPPPELKSRLQERIRRPTERPVAGRESWLSTLRSALWRPVPAWSLGLAGLVLLFAVATLIWGAAPSPVEPFYTVALVATDNAPNASGLIILDGEGEYGSVVVDGLPDLPADQAYQLWLIQDGDRTSGAVFSTHEGYAQAEVVASQPLSAYNAFGITVEPAGGSPGPTGDKVLGSN